MLLINTIMECLRDQQDIKAVYYINGPIKRHEFVDINIIHKSRKEVPSYGIFMLSIEVHIVGDLKIEYCMLGGDGAAKWTAKEQHSVEDLSTAMHNIIAHLRRNI